MFKRSYFLTGVSVLGMTLCFWQVQAHTSLCSCYDNGDGMITCEGGFSDGSPSVGVQMCVVKIDGSILVKGKMDEDSQFTFDKPVEGYKVVFDAGDDHAIEIDGKEIDE